MRFPMLQTVSCPGILASSLLCQYLDFVCIGCSERSRHVVMQYVASSSPGEHIATDGKRSILSGKLPSLMNLLASAGWAWFFLFRQNSRHSICRSPILIADVTVSCRGVELLFILVRAHEQKNYEVASLLCFGIEFFPCYDERP